MSLFGKNWAGEILLETKRIFGLDHDASEQEVHEHLRSVESYDSVLAKANEAGQEELNTATALLQTANSEKEAFENRVNELTSQVDALQSTVDAFKTEVEQLKADVTAKTAEIEQLKSEPAATHTGGDTPPAKPGSERAYHKDPVYQKAKAMRTTPQ